MIAKPTLKMAMAAAEMLYSAKAKQTPKMQMYANFEHVSITCCDFAVGRSEKHESSHCCGEVALMN